MKASSLVENTRACIKIYGDREIVYLSVRKDTNGKLYSFEETISSVMVHGGMNENEPITLFGNNYNSFLEEPLIKLNWLGRMLKKVICKQVDAINPPPLSEYKFGK